MALKTSEFTATFGRDAGKQFIITEMPAMQASHWAGRVLAALLAAGVDIPEDAAQSGMAGMAAFGADALVGQGALKMNLDYEGRVQPLLDDLIKCVKRREPAIDRNLIWGGDNPDIEEARTVFMLHKAVLDLHLGFSIAAQVST